MAHTHGWKLGHKSNDFRKKNHSIAWLVAAYSEKELKNHENVDFCFGCQSRSDSFYPLVRVCTDRVSQGEFTRVISV